MPAARSLSILVSGFEGLRVTEKTLKECFEIVGEVKEIVIPPSGLFAETTIRYADAESAARAVHRYHMGFLNGQTLRVRLAEAEARVPPPPPPPDSKRRTVGAAPQKTASSTPAEPRPAQPQSRIAKAVGTVAADDGAGPATVLPSAPGPAEDWKKFATPEGKLYYFSRTCMETRWERPQELGCGAEPIGRPRWTSPAAVPPEPLVTVQPALDAAAKKWRERQAAKRTRGRNKECQRQDVGPAASSAVAIRDRSPPAAAAPVDRPGEECTEGRAPTEVTPTSVSPWRAAYRDAAAVIAAAASQEGQAGRESSRGRPPRPTPPRKRPLASPVGGPAPAVSGRPRVKKTRERRRPSQTRKRPPRPEGAKTGRAPGARPVRKGGSRRKPSSSDTSSESSSSSSERTSSSRSGSASRSRARRRGRAGRPHGGKPARRQDSKRKDGRGRRHTVAIAAPLRLVPREEVRPMPF